MRQVSRYFIHVVIVVRGDVGPAGIGHDEYGEPIATATPETITVNARVEFDNFRVMSDRGEEIVCSARCFLPWTYTDGAGVEQDLNLGGQDRIIFEGREYAIERRDRQEGWTSDRGRHWEAALR